MSFRNWSSIWDIFLKPRQSLQCSESIRTYKGLCHHHVLYTKCWFWIANKCSNFLRKKEKEKEKQVVRPRGWVDWVSAFMFKQHGWAPAWGHLRIKMELVVLPWQTRGYNKSMTTYIQTPRSPAKPHTCGTESSSEAVTNKTEIFFLPFLENRVNIIPSHSS